METIQEFKHFSFSTQLAVSCFVAGSLIFGLYFALPQNEGILILGLSFVIFAAFFNSAIVLNLVYQMLTIPAERENIIIKILIVLANIPIVIFYTFLIIQDSKSTFIQ